MKEKKQTPCFKKGWITRRGSDEACYAGLEVPQNNLVRKRSDLEDKLSRQNQRRSLLTCLRQEIAR